MIVVRTATLEPVGRASPDFSSAYFDREEFDKLIVSHGYCVTWEKSSLCPNRPAGGVSPRAHDPNCSFCDGRQLVYFDSCETEMLIQAVKLSQQFLSSGRWDTGMSLVTARPGEQIGPWDRITLKNGARKFSENVRRQGGGDTDVLKYAPRDVFYASWVNRDGLLVRLRHKVDFTVSGNRLAWTTEGPDAGSYYSVAYTFRPRYVLLDMVHEIREQPDDGGPRRPFPVQAVARLDYLVRDESRDPSEVVDDTPFRT